MKTIKLILALASLTLCLVSFQNCKDQASGGESVFASQSVDSEEEPAGGPPQVPAVGPSDLQIVDPSICGAFPETGNVCPGGSIFVGVYEDTVLMVTPPGCGQDPTSSCGDGIDTLTLPWVGVGGTLEDLPELFNHSDGTADPAEESGAGNSESIVNAASTAPGSAAEYCLSLEYGGHDDWFLPSKSEMKFVFCRAESPNYLDFTDRFPQEDPGCAAHDGHDGRLSGFQPFYYWTSSETSAETAQSQHFGNGPQPARPKGVGAYVRCVRRQILNP